MSRHIHVADLPEDIARIAEAQVAAGNFATIEDVVRASVQALEARDREWLEYARDLWHERAAAAERGEFSEGTPSEMMARIRAHVERPA
jgi:Arc/MetJ-type ribon-helix-helix transcriptional regulator